MTVVHNNTSGEPHVQEESVTVAVRGLTKTYGEGAAKVDAVRDVDLDVHAGEVLLVMGPSGSGKTTLLLMLGALLRPTAGSIVVTSRSHDSIDLATTLERELPALRAHTFGFIFQDYALLDALTATENIAVAANIAGTKGTAADNRAKHLLDRVGLAHRATARGGRGLMLVELLSEQWGARTESDGSKSVWASFATRTRPGPAPVLA
jgi:ABC-type lipoprotein export system ATPase subunit